MSDRRPRSGSRFEALPQDVEGIDPLSRPSTSTGIFGTQPIASTSHQQTSAERPKRLVRSRTASDLSFSKRHEESTGLQFDWTHFGNVSKTIDDSDLTDSGNLFEEEIQLRDTPTNVAEDIEILKDIEVIIDYVDGLLGEGVFGVVYRGYYGKNIENFQNVEPSRRFAVKIIDMAVFGNPDDSDNLQKRERFETEKYILTEVNHRNVVTIKMIVNMGEQQSYPFVDNPISRYLSADRAYLIMGYADQGDLETWMRKNRNSFESSLRINFIRDLFFGMLYLHLNNIIHGDVHTGNVLIFTEGDDLVAKWSDFGLGFVGSDKQYQWRTARVVDTDTDIRFDIECMHIIVGLILEDRELCRPETPLESTVLDEFKRMIIVSKKVNSLLELYHKFTYILEEELEFEDYHFTE